MPSRSASTPRSRRRRAASTADEILNAAEGLFEERGYTGTSLAEVAREAGIRAPSLLYHFESKAQLLDEVLGRIYRAARERIYEALATGVTPVDRIQKTVEVTRDLVAQHPRLLQIALGELLKPDGVGRHYLYDMSPQVLDAVESILRETFDPPLPEPAPLRTALMTLTVTHLWRLLLGDVGEILWGPEDQVMELQRLLVTSLAEGGKGDSQRASGLLSILEAR